MLKLTVTVDARLGNGLLVPLNLNFEMWLNFSDDTTVVE